MIELYKTVYLTCDLPEFGLKADTPGCLLDYLRHPNGGEMGCVVEVFDTDGSTIDVVVTLVSNISLTKTEP